MCAKRGPNFMAPVIFHRGTTDNISETPYLRRGVHLRGAPAARQSVFARGEEQKGLSSNVTRSEMLTLTGDSAGDVEEWMVSDSSDSRFKILNDNRFIESVREESVLKEDDPNLEVAADMTPLASESICLP
ncbi:hypothetical protein EVAR_94097_1 [Eumeta japonica]|uniref:Uncharacterized protein n=1 Tax=Eumeta variegata TaxID=151549 RepID=A0A4C1V6Z9_EUMVA|nr:hypothetical protein EVAR_94097_1 [Eumeta japonica]